MARGFGGVSPVGRTSKLNAVVIGGVVVALLCVTIAFVLLSNSKPATTQTVVVEKDAPVKMVDVLVPTTDISMGAALEPAMFRLETRPATFANPRAVHSLEEIKNQFARTLIVGGQPLAQDFITPVRPSNALTANIPDGYRAVTIKVDVRTSVEGFVQPGAKVDVGWTSVVKGKPSVKVIVQNAKVLSAERQTQGSAEKGTVVPSTVTLLVTDRDASKITLASTTGTLSLSLRGDTDPGKTVVTDSVTIEDLLDSGDGSKDEERSTGTISIAGKKYKVLSDGTWKLVGE